MKLLLTYDLHEASPERYAKFNDLLENSGWTKVLDTVWVADGDKSVESIAMAFQATLNPGDKYVVTNTGPVLGNVK